MSPKPGDQLGDGYQLVERLGAGGMGEVWLATEVRLGRKVALKFLPADLTRDPLRVQRFEQEARAASALNHPNVCTIHALGQTADGQHYIAMEYVEGETLRQRLSTSRLTIRESLDIAIQVAAALSAAHSGGIIHRDIKPENVMLRPDGLVKVLDFGLAKLMHSTAELVGTDTTQTVLNTDPGVVVGTVVYMSPEQIRGETLDARTDVFSLGATFYEMVTGHRAFAGTVSAMVQDAILNRAPVSPSRLNPHLPPRLDDIISKALEKDCELRYQTVSELRTDLIRLRRDSELTGHVALQTGGAATAVTNTSTRLRRAARASRLAALVVAAVAIAWSVLPLVRRAELKEVRLTTNSSEAPVTAAAISPDGKYIAYGDEAGLHLQLIGSGETQSISVPDAGTIGHLAWFPDGSKVVLSGAGAAGQLPGAAIWSVSIIGGKPRKIRDDGLDASVAPDGSRIGFVDTQRKSIWVMGVNGEEPHRVLTRNGTDTFWLPRFRDNSRLMYGRVQLVAENSRVSRQQVSLESREPDGRSTLLLSDPGLRAAAVLPNGRLIYSILAQPLLERDASLWSTSADPQIAVLRRNPQRITGWTGAVSLWDFTATADGTRIAFLKRERQGDVYTADVTPDGSLANPRRFTLNDSDDFPTNWMPDSRTLLFASDRNGTFDIFRQALDDRSAEAVVAGPDDEKGPTAVTPDGAWFYYQVEPKRWQLQPVRNWTVMRTPATGGPSQQVDTAGQGWVSCARLPSTVCVLAEHDGGREVIYALDSARGKGRQIASTEVGRGPPPPTALSPDGSRLAILLPDRAQIRTLSLSGESPRTTTIMGRSLDWTVFYWSADGTAWYLSSPSSPFTPAGTDLLLVDPGGSARVIWHQTVLEPIHAIPSPDGRHIAFSQATTVSNVWMMTGF